MGWLILLGFTLSYPFIGHPGRCVLALAILLLLWIALKALHGSKLKVPPAVIIVTVLCWIFATIWELHCITMQSNIRVDAICIYPPLIIISIAEVLYGFLFHRAKSTHSNNRLRK